MRLCRRSFLLVDSAASPRHPRPSLSTTFYARLGALTCSRVVSVWRNPAFVSSTIADPGSKILDFCRHSRLPLPLSPNWFDHSQQASHSILAHTLRASCFGSLQTQHLLAVPTQLFTHNTFPSPPHHRHILPSHILPRCLGRCCLFSNAVQELEKLGSSGITHCIVVICTLHERARGHTCSGREEQRKEATTTLSLSRVTLRPRAPAYCSNDTVEILYGRSCWSRGILRLLHSFLHSTLILKLLENTSCSYHCTSAGRHLIFTYSAVSQFHCLSSQQRSGTVSTKFRKHSFLQPQKWFNLTNPTNSKVARHFGYRPHIPLFSIITLYALTILHY